MNALPIFLLPFVTMGIPLLWGIWEFTRARKAGRLADDGMNFSGMRRNGPQAADFGDLARPAPVAASAVHPIGGHAILFGSGVRDPLSSIV